MCHGKQGYRDENSVATAALLYEGIRGQSLYWYACPSCGDFHLTSSPRYRPEEKAVQDTIKNRILKKRSLTAEATSDPNHQAVVRQKLISENDLEGMLDWNKTHPHLSISKKIIEKAMVEKLVGCI
jgi:hypothetical protein